MDLEAKLGDAVEEISQPVKMRSGKDKTTWIPRPPAKSVVTSHPGLTHPSCHALQIRCGHAGCMVGFGFGFGFGFGSESAAVARVWPVAQHSGNVGDEPPPPLVHTRTPVSLSPPFPTHSLSPINVTTVPLPCNMPWY